MLALLSLSEFASHLLDYHARVQLASTLLPRPCAKFGNLSDCFLQEMLQRSPTCRMCQIATDCV